MIHEIDAGGLFFAPLIVSAVVALPLWLLARAGLTRAGAYRLVWHPALFDVALYVVLFALVSLQSLFPEI
ncbi:MAG: DUF1656 domain-containing protein [Parvibaculaceae bacterium]